MTTSMHQLDCAVWSASGGCTCAPDDEGDRHGCCCEHVVETLAAVDVEQYALARDKWYSCPHKNLTPLEIYLMHIRPNP